MEKLYFHQTILLAVNTLVKILMGKETETMGQNETFDVYMNFIFLYNLFPLQKGELIVQLCWRGGQNKGGNQPIKFRQCCFSDPFIAVLDSKNILYQAKCLLVPGKGQIKQFNVTFTIICHGFFFLVVVVVSIFHCSKSPLASLVFINTNIPV